MIVAFKACLDRFLIGDNFMVSRFLRGGSFHHLELCQEVSAGGFLPACPSH